MTCMHIDHRKLFIPLQFETDIFTSQERRLFIIFTVWCVLPAQMKWVYWLISVQISLCSEDSLERSILFSLPQTEYLCRFPLSLILIKLSHMPNCLCQLAVNCFNGTVCSGQDLKEVFSISAHGNKSSCCFNANAGNRQALWKSNFFNILWWK